MVVYRLPGDLMYWRDGNAEIDYVLKIDGHVIGIEVKSGRRKRQNGIIAFKKALLKAREIQLLENPVWISTKAKLVVTHAEAVVALPECMSALATSEQVRIDGLQHKTKPVFGFQSHPEATVEFLKGHEMLEDQAVEALVDGASIMGSFMSLVHKFRG